MAPLHNDDKINSWTEYKRLVINELERLDRTIIRYSEKYEQGLQDVKEAVSELRVEMLNGISNLQDTVEKAHNDKYTELENRVRINETEISNMLGKAAGISFAIGLVVSVVGVIVTYFAK